MTRKQKWGVALCIIAAVALVATGVGFLAQARTMVQQWPAEDQIAATELIPGDGTFVDPTKVDQTDPDAVAEAVALLTASHDTATDYTETAAVRRAEPLLAPELHAALVEPERGAGGHSWLVASEHQAYAMPAATEFTTHAQHDHGGVEHGHDEEVKSAAGEDILPYEYRVTFRWQGRDVDGLRWTSNPDFPEVRNVQLSLAERDGKWVVVEHLYVTPTETDYR